MHCLRNSTSSKTTTMRRAASFVVNATKKSTTNTLRLQQQQQQQTYARISSSKTPANRLPITITTTTTTTNSLKNSTSAKQRQQQPRQQQFFFNQFQRRYFGGEQQRNYTEVASAVKYAEASAEEDLVSADFNNNNNNNNIAQQENDDRGLSLPRIPANVITEGLFKQSNGADDTVYVTAEDLEILPQFRGQKDLSYLSNLWTSQDEYGSTDPSALVEADLMHLAESVKATVSSDHPVLDMASKYFFNIKGKRFRPMIVLLISSATSDRKANNWLPTQHADAKQTKLAEITEMIHTASLVHDDIIDEADTRRGEKSLNAAFGNKVAVLAGDFLLARASLALARLRNVEVIELLSTVIEHLAHGEVLQMASAGSNSFEEYLKKTFYKTSSLIALSCKAAAILGNATPEATHNAFLFGKHLGLAYQFIDDMLDFTGTEETIGKPACGADMKLGLATAPVLFALEEYPELGELIEREFSHEGDIEKALALIHKSNGIARTRELAATHCQKAIDALMKLEPSPARGALINLVGKIMLRNK